MAEITISFESVSESDFDALAQLRIDAMRESLERVGRFDPIRARERLKKTFDPRATEWIVRGGQRIGFYAMRKTDSGYSLDHLYIHPKYQRLGYGAQVLGFLKAKSDREGLPVKVGALRESDSNQFYRREGFRKISEDEWDIYYTYRGTEGTET